MPFFDRVNNFIDDALADVAAAGARAPGRATSTGILRIEPDQVDAAINVFEDALHKLKRKVDLAKEGIRANPMAADQVSRPAATAFNHASFDGPGAAVAVWTRAVAELESIIRQLRISKEAITRTDGVTSQALTSAAGALG